MSINLLNDISNTYPLCINCKESIQMGSGLELAYVNAATSTVTVNAIQCNYNPNVIILSLKLNIASFVITSGNVIRTDTLIPLLFRPVAAFSHPCIVSIDGINTVCNLQIGFGGKITLKPLNINFTIGQVITFNQLSCSYTV